MQYLVYHLFPQITPWMVYSECQLLWCTFWILQVVPSNSDYYSSRNYPEWLVTWQTCGLSFIVHAEQRVWECFFSLSELRGSEETWDSSLFKWDFFLPFIFGFISVYPWHFSRQAASSRSTICFSFQLWHHLREYLLTRKNTCGVRGMVVLIILICMIMYEYIHIEAYISVCVCVCFFICFNTRA